VPSRSAAFAIGLAIDTLPFAQIVVAAFIEGTGYVFFRLSESAALPQIVPKPQLPTAVARNQARDQGADLAGQPLGGALFGITRLLPFAADAVSYAISFASLLFVRPAFQEQRERAHPSACVLRSLKAWRGSGDKPSCAQRSSWWPARTLHGAR
jgi:hypothetical protein